MKHVAKTEVVRIRCEREWKNQFEMFARSKRLDVSEAVRIACNDLMDRHANRKPMSVLSNGKE